MSSEWSLDLSVGMEYFIEVGQCIQVTLATLQPKAEDESDSSTHKVQLMHMTEESTNHNVLCTLNYETCMQEILEFHMAKEENIYLYIVEDGGEKTARVHLTG